MKAIAILMESNNLKVGGYVKTSDHRICQYLGNNGEAFHISCNGRIEEIKHISEIIPMALHAISGGKVLGEISLEGIEDGDVIDIMRKDGEIKTKCPICKRF